MNKENFIKKLEDKIPTRSLDLVMLAYKIAKECHRGETRKSTGIRYFEHCRSCCLILIDELQIYDYQMLCSALLHDTIENSHMFNLKDMQLIFGREVKKMIEALTKPKIDDQLIRNFKYYDIIISADKKTTTVKLADRLHNLRDMKDMKPEFIEKQIKETEMVYLPLAEKVNHGLYELLQKELTKLKCIN